MGTESALRANLLSTVALPERYVVLEHIAHGGMASVWCAEDVALGRRVAIKLLDERFRDDDAAGARFKREARTAAQLSRHRNIVTIFDVGECEGHAFIVMEYLAGGTVAGALRRGPVPRAEAIRWLRAAADALDYAHRSGVVHRDIKPANLLLDGDRVLHIGDFGIARLLRGDTITASGQLFGTAAYLAPEQALGEPASAASDRYSLAVAAFELLAGERPFTAEHFAAQARQHIEAEPPRASERNILLPAALDPVLAQGLAKAPEDRWASAQELVDGIERALARRRRPGAPRPAAPRLLAPLPRPTAQLPRAATASEWRNATAASDRRRWRAIAPVALLAVALAAVLLAGVATNGSSHHLQAAHRALAPKRAVVTPPPARHTAAARTTAAPLGTPTSTDTTAPAAGGDSAALEAQGHQLMLGGSYGQAIDVLRRAVASADPASLTYAYALYDLGHSLRLSGDSQGAIPILERRLQIPNQTGVVASELRAAQQQAGDHGSAAGGGNAGDHGNSGGGNGNSGGGDHRGG